MSSITINQIISYLSNKSLTNSNENINNSLVQKKYDIISLDNCSNFFKNIFNNSLYRQGINQTWKTIKEEFNISLISSVLHNLDNDFHSKSETEQLEYIDNLVIKMLYDINNEKLFTKFNYRSSKIKKQDLIDEIKNYKNTNKVIRFLSDYFDINIFILNIQKNELFCMYGENEFNKYKKSIFIARVDNNAFEPIQSNNNTYFTYSDKVIKNLIENYKINIQTFYSKLFEVRSDHEINSITNTEQEDEHEDDEQNNEQNDEQEDDEQNDEQEDDEQKDDEQEDEPEDEEVNEQEDDEQEDNTKPEYSNKMKLDELQKLAEKYSIDITKKINNKNKKKTKKELITDLDNFFC